MPDLHFILRVHALNISSQSRNAADLAPNSLKIYEADLTCTNYFQIKLKPTLLIVNIFEIDH